MTLRRIALVPALAFISSLVCAQSWMAAYDKGLKAARVPDWVSARAAFQQAIAYRPDDISGPTTLPGPVTEQRRWRDGAPYSPNFLAAYSEYRIGIAAAKPEDGKPALDTAATEFEALLAKGQNSKEAYWYLDQIYTRLNDAAKRLDVEARATKSKMDFRVDSEVVAPEEKALITGVPQGGKTGTGLGPTVTIIQPGGGKPIPGGNVLPNTGGSVPPAVGPVAPIPGKFALLIGNSTTQLAQGGLTYGADDAQSVREAIVTHAGYPEANVDLVLNATNDQVMASAKALASRVTEDSIVFIFFAGNGSNINGRDYLAGVDTSNDTDAAAMTAKLEIYKLFMAKGAKIYAFFEVPRPVVDGNYFGKEIPLVGAISQVQSTIPGDPLSSTTKGGRTIGVFADAMVTTFQELRSNHLPVMEFGWQVFNRMRGGGTGHSGGGGRQVCTLPVLTHLGPDDRF